MITRPPLAASDRARDQVPVQDHPTTRASLPRPVIEVPAGSPLRRVLLVDDEAGIRRSVGRFLRRYGYEVTDVPNAQAAMNALRAGEFDAVVSDLRMPGLTGEEFYLALRREFPDMARRVVFTSGDTMREETRQFLDDSGCPSLQKPYELAELMQLLTSLCPPAAGVTHRAGA